MHPKVELNHARGRATRSAFTLIEILVVVVILGIAGAIIIPQMGTRDDLKAASISRVLMSDLIYAQNKAITDQKMVWVVFDVENQRYTVCDGTPDVTKVMKHPVSKENYVVQFGPAGDRGFTEVAIDSAAFTGPSSGTTPRLAVGFDELGSPRVITSGTLQESITSGAVVLSCNEHRLRVEVEPFTGQLNVVTP